MGKSQKSMHSLAAKNLKDMRPESPESPLVYLSGVTPGPLAEVLIKSPQTSNFILARLIERIKNL